MKGISRRDFLKSSALTAGALSLGVRSWAQQTEPVEALIVGSGLAGAITACRLAQAGINVVMLERGQDWPTPAKDTFCDPLTLDGRAAWLSDQAGVLPPTVPVDRFTGVLETIAGNNITLLCGAGKGGSTLNYNAITLIPEEKLFRKFFPGVSFEEMVNVFYPRAESVLKAQVIPQDLLQSPIWESTRINLQQAENAGFKIKPAPLAVDWDRVRQEMNGTLTPSMIAGAAWFGVNSGAKNSVDHNYLPMAEATGNLEILTLHVVTDVIEVEPHRWVVVANKIDNNGMVLETRRFATRNLFLAAGSIGTTKLLVRAQALGTIQNPVTFGEHAGTNGDFVAIRGVNESNNAGQGGPAGHFLMEDLHPEGQEPANIADMIELVFPARNAFDGGSLYVGLGIEPAVLTYTFNPATDQVDITLPPNNSPRLQRFEAGANDLVNTLNQANPGSSTAFLSINFTAHPVGGANMGHITDTFGRVLHHEGLFVTDAAVIPTIVPGVNPSFTIAAIAERCLQGILDRGDLAHG